MCVCVCVHVCGMCVRVCVYVVCLCACVRVCVVAMTAYMCQNSKNEECQVLALKQLLVLKQEDLEACKYVVSQSGWRDVEGEQGFIEVPTPSCRFVWSVNRGGEGYILYETLVRALQLHLSFNVIKKIGDVLVIEAS